MTNAIAIRNLDERRAMYRARAKARDTARASGVRLDLAVNLMGIDVARAMVAFFAAARRA